jgi:undecaprenyl-phosphate 4-deoxy-4-formamido-L-arabinose transferase
MISVSVVVPVYNSADTLGPLVERLDPVLIASSDRHEIILVDDGSRDASWARVRELSAQYPAVRGVMLRRNFGQHNAVLAGVRMATGDVIVTVDDDLQHPPEEIPVLLAALTAEHDVVYGTPRRQQHGWWRDAGSRAAKWALQVVFGWNTAQKVSDFRVFRTELREGFAHVDGPWISFDAVLAWVTSAFCWVEVEHAPRRVGRSNYRLRGLMEYGVTMITGHSSVPLRLSAIVGGPISLAGLILIAVGSVVGGLVLLVGGLELVAIGIVGEYLGRVFFRVMQRPGYVVRAEVGKACSGGQAASASRDPDREAD